LDIVRTVLDEFINPHVKTVFGFLPPGINHCEPLSPKWRFITGISWFFLGRSTRAMVLGRNTKILYNPWRFGNRRLNNAIRALKKGSATKKQKELIGDLVFTLLHEATHLYQPLLGDIPKRGYRIWHEGTADVAAFILSSQLADRLRDNRDHTSRFSSGLTLLQISSESLVECLSLYTDKRAEDLSWALHAAPVKIPHHPAQDFIPPNSWTKTHQKNKTAGWKQKHALLNNPRRWVWNRFLVWEYAVGSLMIAQKMKKENLSFNDIFRSIADSEVLKTIMSHKQNV